MRGSAVVSAGGSDEMDRLKKAFPQDTSAGKILESDGEPRSCSRACVPLAAKQVRRPRANGQAAYLDLTDLPTTIRC
jgi:hypothetical protein